MKLYLYNYFEEKKKKKKLYKQREKVMFIRNINKILNYNCIYILKNKIELIYSQLIIIIFFNIKNNDYG
ncbi:hypothetical protein PFUGPA_03942 [Plasmodium falciparum Palo Alto/Uganda]|uniref:Uncharacterized protein n=1 Tax=Plasmodium falciparum (isolate Palo Alto / Uganda) TaxID=57270 RepID=W4IVP7_PLAFP|nr:hypothetical protein PFUGPA_03942 [Plasmodium falciparum Palo Alto/Uganda]